MKVIVCFGEVRILVPCDAGEDMTVKELSEIAVTKFKKVTNKSPDEEIKISYLKTQSEGAMVDPDDKVANVAEDKEIFTAVLEEPLQTQFPIINTSNGQLVLAVINNDGSQSTDSIVSSLQLGSGGNLANLSPMFSNAIMSMLQQSMSQQQQLPTTSSTTTVTPVNTTSNASQLPAITQGNDGNNISDEGDDGEESDDKDGKKDFSCDQCAKKFTQSWKLRQHLIAHARRDEMKKYECDKCAASFISEWLLLRHAKIHTGATKPRFCLVCNRAFRGSTDLKVHMRTHTGEKPFKCETCGKAFGDRSALRRHTMTHTGEKPRPCPHCPRAFRQTAPLITHMRQRHNIDIRHRCDVCYMSFCEDDPYVLHMASVHHRTIALEELKKGDESSGLDMEQQELENEDGTGVVDDGGHMVDDDGHMVDDSLENGAVKHTMVSNAHLVQHCDEDSAENKDTENREQVAAERSLHDAYITESGDGEQGEAITITAVAAGQGGQEIVLPADLVVAHQLIAVQQSSMDV
ncbi:zinc finger and SCAN domain-containing protein 12-like [Dendronephthya gigantea]|uniref:zinc finger and SCAN domain-containing protein 12-like n=1 Tax=Dendronephthya gigantea TaxID=151771 RepID=UPI00106D2C3D|nr:zinc finger and SCAN domain-containing protein 12-like [Dendronephthya gigantea]